MPITITCPKCAQMCQVDDQHAGKLVGCPNCKNAIQVPPAASPVTAVPIVVAAPIPEPAVAEAAPTISRAGPGLAETLNQSIAKFGLDPLSMKLIYAGLGCFAAMIVFTLLPWLTISFSFPGAGRVPGFSGPGFTESHSALGVQIGIGWMNILLTLGAGGFVLAAFLVLKTIQYLDYSLWAAAGWAIVASLWRLINVIQLGGFSGIGLYLTLLAALGAAGTFGFVVFQRLSRRNKGERRDLNPPV